MYKIKFRRYIHNSISIIVISFLTKRLLYLVVLVFHLKCIFFYHLNKTYVSAHSCIHVASSLLSVSGRLDDGWT